MVVRGLSGRTDDPKNNVYNRPISFNGTPSRSHETASSLAPDGLGVRCGDGAEGVMKPRGKLTIPSRLALTTTGSVVNETAANASHTRYSKKGTAVDVSPVLGGYTDTSSQ